MSDGFDFATMRARGENAGVPELFVLVMTPMPDVSDRVPHVAAAGESTPLEAHYAYVHRLIEEGKVVLGGPCMGEPKIAGQAPVPPGLVVLRVDNREEAEEIARNEPFHAMGWRHNTVLAWTPKFGSLIQTVAQAL